jgi:hypothetical protein
MTMARLLAEDGGNAARILTCAAWEAPGGLLEEAIAGWGEEYGALKAAFDAKRAETAGAIADLIPLYPGIGAALRACPYPVYYASSKREDRLLALLNAHLGLALEPGSPRVFAGLIPPAERKAAALRAVAARAPRVAALHFVDDRFETVADLAAMPDISERYNLYFAEYGYSTPAERAAAAALPGVAPLALPALCELLTWGSLQGVDDGCEPTREEARAGVFTPRGGNGSE